MKYISVQIGNSDNKLTQEEWSKFVDDVAAKVNSFSFQIHFFGGAPNWMPWQNACWVFETYDEYVLGLRSELIELRKKYKQDSICWLEGLVEFI